MRLRECELIPRGYGRAWIDPLRCEYVYLLVPFNLIAALGRRVWLALRGGIRPTETEIACQLAVIAARREARAEVLTSRTRETRLRDFEAGRQFELMALSAYARHLPEPDPPEWVRWSEPKWIKAGVNTNG